jgi:TolB protein
MTVRSYRMRTIVTGVLALGNAACAERVVGPGVEQVEEDEHLLFLSTRDGAHDQLERPMREIYRMSSDGSDAVNLTRHPSSIYSHLSASPDGRTVALASDRSGCDIWVMNTDGGNVAQLTGREPGEGCNAWPRWSPDGTRIAFASNREGRRVDNTTGLYDVYVMNADGSMPRNVSQSLGEALGFNVHVVGWSPAGQIVFETDDITEDGPVRRVYIVNADGADVRPLFDRMGDHSPAWSPDGARITFISDRDGRRRLYVMNADGTGARPLTDHSGDDRLPGGCCGFRDASFDISPWSPDGKRIAFERFVDEADWGTIYVVDLDGADPRRLTDFSASFNGWSPSGGRIALTRRMSPAASDIFVIDADGSGLRNLTRSPAEDTDAFWVRH